MIVLNTPSAGGGTDPLAILASQAQAEAGTANDVLMTPLRTKEAVTALALLKSGGTLTGPVCVPFAANISLANARDAGFLFGASPATATAAISAFNNTLQFYANSTFIGQLNTNELGLPSTTLISFSSVPSPSSSKDLDLGRGGAATLQIGKNHATTATAQVFKSHNVTTGTGGSLEIAGGTGSVARGNVTLNGGNRSAYIASPSTTQIRDILISHGLMAAS